MNIGIIGAGNIGATLAAKLSACGHSVRLANSRGPETIAEVARKAGATAVTREEAVKDADAVILSTPFTAHQGLAELLKTVPASVPVIDTSNYYPFRDEAIPALAQGKAESVWASEQAGRPLIKAWNAVLAATLADKGMPVGVTERIAIPVAGDDETTKRIAMALVSDTGFDAVDAGSLAESWRQQPGTPAYCTELGAAALKKALLAADKERAPVNREALLKEFMSASEPLTHEHIVARNRAVTA